jgi:indole-3-glycerol phosphate synthase
MAIASARRARAAARRLPEPELRARAAEAPPAPPFVPSPDGFDVIAEIKRRAPGGAPEGGARNSGDPDLPERLADAYAGAGAVAVSVLTEPLAFGGAVDDLARASRRLAGATRPVPTMRKDFVVDPYQVVEARAAGAGGILLIAELLDADTARRLLDAAAEMRLWVLVEAFGNGGVARAAAIVGRARSRGVSALLGVNVRDLRTLDVDPGRLARAAGQLPPEVLAVAESGMREPADVAAAARLGYRFALIGRALTAAVDPGSRLAELIRSGRRARQEAA